MREVGYSISLTREIHLSVLSDFVVSAFYTPDVVFVHHFRESSVDLAPRLIDIQSYYGGREDQPGRRETFEDPIIYRQLHPPRRIPTFDHCQPYTEACLLSYFNYKLVRLISLIGANTYSIGSATSELDRHVAPRVFRLPEKRADARVPCTSAVSVWEDRTVRNEPRPQKLTRYSAGESGTLARIRPYRDRVLSDRRGLARDTEGPSRTRP